MRFLKKLSGLNQSGIIHLIPLLVILLGIIGGVYLVQHPQIFKPKAAGESVEFLDGNCVKVKDGKKVLVCDQFQMRIRSPLETGQTTDTGPNMSLVKTAYADDPEVKKIQYCGTDWLAGALSTNSFNTVYAEDGSRLVTCLPVLQECREYNQTANEITAKCFLRWESTPTYTSTVSDPTKGADQQPAGSQVPATQTKPVNISPKGDVEILEEKEYIDFYWASPARLNVSTYRFMVTSTEDNRKVGNETNCPANFIGNYRHCSQNLPELENNGKNLKGGIVGVSSWWEDGATYTWWVDALDENGNKIGTSDGFQFTVHKKVAAEGGAGTTGVGATSPGEAIKIAPSGKPGSSSSACPPGSDKKATYGQCGGEIGLEGKDPTHEFEVTEVKDCRGNPKPYLVKDNGVSSRCPRGGTPATGALPEKATVNTCKGVKTWDQIDAELKGANYDGAFNHSGEELGAYNRTACPRAEGGGTPIPGSSPVSTARPTRVTIKYRLALNPIDLEKATWYDYTVGGVTVNVPSPQFTLGNPRLNTTQSIHVQFMDDQLQPIKFSTGEDFTISYIDFVDCASVPGANCGASNPSAVVPPVDNSDSSNSNTGCPFTTYSNYDILTLKQKCSLLELSRLPFSALKDFSNQDLLDIARNIDGVDGPYQFLSQFDNVRLASFDLEVLKKLTKDRFIQLPENLQNAIKGTDSQTSEQASCQSISLSGAAVYYATVKFRGQPQTVKIWLASNLEIDKPASEVQSWTIVNTLSNPASGSFYPIDIPQGFTRGQHAVLMSLYGSYGQMLDGNPNDVVNPSCATTVTIK